MTEYLAVVRRSADPEDDGDVYKITVPHGKDPYEHFYEKYGEYAERVIKGKEVEE